MKKILIVDDEPHVIRLLRMSLERAGYSVDCAPNGALGWQKILESQPDVLITDIAMPELTGEQLCKMIAADLPERDFLIFVTTSRTEIEHREWSRKIDNLMFLEKPVSVRKLMSMLEDYFVSGPHSKGEINV